MTLTIRVNESDFGSDKSTMLEIKINYYETVQKNRSKKSNAILYWNEWRQWLRIDTNMQ